jgi:NAD(P)-dependent dehydrogenase (short-subunit alcohol dehydrogenase family)
MPTAVVTGANSGIGKALATGLASRGFHVVLACRDPGRGEEARRDIVAASGSSAVELLLCDLSRPESIRAFAATLGQRHARLDVLVHNAGIYLPKRQLTADGREMMFAVNHLGPFLLTHLLLDRLDGARVITVSSVGHRFCRFDLANLEGERYFRGSHQYGITKLANILFTRELARREARRGLVANCFHPGGVATNFAQGEQQSALGVVMRLGIFLLRTPEKGAETGVFLATAADGGQVSGEYWNDRHVARTSRAARSSSNAHALWERSEALLGLGHADPQAG